MNIADPKILPATESGTLKIKDTETIGNIL
jgi:hypothetical protein